MTSRLDKKLKRLWNHALAKPVNIYEVIHEGEKIQIETNHTYSLSPCLWIIYPLFGTRYYFVSDGQKAHRRFKRHQLWKGIVLEIRTLPCDIFHEALISVQWFWSKRDIEDEFIKRGIEIPETMRIALDSMGEMELCPSSDCDINQIGCLYGSADVIELHVDPTGSAGSRLEKQTYITEYFYRSGFDRKELTLRGHSTLGCGMEDCLSGWNPDNEEQRYCYICGLWFHTGCLTVSKGKTQEFVVQNAAEDENLPQILLDMAYQPAARGGERHFHAGNIRIVSQARDLVRNQKKRKEFAGNEVWSDEEWKHALLELFGMKKSHEGKADREQLVLYGQVVYDCVCGGYI